MQYKKGTFIVVPNIDRLDTIPAIAQATFLWICKYANDDGECFPARSRLAKHVGCDVRTIDRHLTILQENGFLLKIKRQKQGSKENMSNLYQIQIDRYPSDYKDTTPSDTNDTVTIPNINYTYLTNNTDVPSDKPKEEIITTGQLPASFGKSYIMRLHYVYRYLWMKHYGTKLPTSNSIGAFGKAMKTLIQTYSEKQIAVLLLTYFNWRGGSGDNDKDNKYLSDNGFPPYLMLNKIDIFIMYLTNNLRLCYTSEEDIDMYLRRNLKDILA